jgi:hypothetical protein
MAAACLVGHQKISDFNSRPIEFFFSFPGHIFGQNNHIEALGANFRNWYDFFPKNKKGKKFKN